MLSAPAVMTSETETSMMPLLSPLLHAPTPYTPAAVYASSLDVTPLHVCFLVRTCAYTADFELRYASPERYNLRQV